MSEPRVIHYQFNVMGRRYDLTASEGGAWLRIWLRVMEIPLKLDESVYSYIQHRRLLSTKRIYNPDVHHQRQLPVLQIQKG